MYLTLRPIPTTHVKSCHGLFSLWKAPRRANCIIFGVLFWLLHTSIHPLYLAWGRQLAGFGAIVLGGYVKPPNLPQGVRWVSVQHLFAEARMGEFVAAGWPMAIIADYIRLVIVFSLCRPPVIFLDAFFYGHYMCVRCQMQMTTL